MRFIFLALLLGGCATSGERTDLPGPLTPERLARAVEAAGLRAGEVELRLPEANRLNLPFSTLPFDDPELRSLRATYDLEGLVEKAKDEWTAQLRLKDWLSKAIPDGTPRVQAGRASEILEQAAKGQTFYCTHFAITYVECALALGWQARRIAVDRNHGPEGTGSSHHGVAEVWSNQHRKWIVIDPQSNLHFEKAGVPLSAWEIRAEWLRDGGKAVDHVVGAPPTTTRKNPAIRWWHRPDEDETATYFWLYIEDSVVRQSGTLFFPQDPANEALTWYQNDSKTGGSVLHTGYRTNRFLRVSPRDAYWTVGITELTLVAAARDGITFSLDSHLPDREGYEVSIDGRRWERVSDEKSVAWPLKPGRSSFAARAVGPRGVRGAPSAVFLALE
jgi:hypothetical protein